MTNKNVMKVLEILIEKTNNLEATTDMLEKDNITLQKRLRQVEEDVKIRWNIIDTLFLINISIILGKEILIPFVHWILQLF